MKVVENSPQNARNCIIFKNILGGIPPNPLATARDMPLQGMYTQNPQKIQVATPPPREILHTHEVSHFGMRSRLRK